VIDFDDAQVYESVMNKILSDPKLYSKLTSWIVRTGKGFHVYVRSVEPLRTRVRFIEGIDVKGEGSYVVAPPSIHPSGRAYSFVSRTEIPVLSMDEVSRLFRLLDVDSDNNNEDDDSNNDNNNDDYCDLDFSTINAIKEVLKPSYRRGRRQMLCLYLAGFMKARGVSLHSTEEVVKRLHGETGDEDPLRMRLSAVHYTYGKERVVGVSGLRKILEEDYAEKAQEVLSVLFMLTEG
jgi:hypothetical protein